MKITEVREGMRVRLSERLELFDGERHFFDAGETGTVTEVFPLDKAFNVRLDAHHRCLDEWDNHLYFEACGDEAYHCRGDDALVDAI